MGKLERTVEVLKLRGYDPNEVLQRWNLEDRLKTEDQKKDHEHDRVHQL